MRRTFAVVVLLVVASSAQAGPSWVDIGRPNIQLLDAGDIPSICNSATTVRACTHISATLTTSCNAGRVFYEMSAIVGLTPRVYLASPSLLAHEMGHVADVAASLRTHVRKLGRQQFDTFDECEAAARVARDTFSITMQSVQQVTDQRRDGKMAPRRVAQGGPKEASRAVRAD